METTTTLLESLMDKKLGLVTAIASATSAVATAIDKVVNLAEHIARLIH